MTPEELSDLVNRAAQLHGVDPALVMSIIKAESDYDPAATSDKGAQGLMQLMPDTAASLGVTNPYDIEQNVMGGTKYLAQLLQQFDNDNRKAVAAYNFGPTAVSQGKPWPSETLAYVDKVLGPVAEKPTAAPVAAVMTAAPTETPEQRKARIMSDPDFAKFDIKAQQRILDRLMGKPIPQMRAAGAGEVSGMDSTVEGVDPLLQGASRLESAGPLDRLTSALGLGPSGPAAPSIDPTSQHVEALDRILSFLGLGSVGRGTPTLEQEPLNERDVARTGQGTVEALMTGLLPHMAPLAMNQPASVAATNIAKMLGIGGAAAGIGAWGGRKVGELVDMPETGSLVGEGIGFLGSTPFLPHTSPALDKDAILAELVNTLMKRGTEVGPGAMEGRPLNFMGQLRAAIEAAKAAITDNATVVEPDPALAAERMALAERGPVRGPVQVGGTPIPPLPDQRLVKTPQEAGVQRPPVQPLQAPPQVVEGPPVATPREPPPPPEPPVPDEDAASLEYLMQEREKLRAERAAHDQEYPQFITGEQPAPLPLPERDNIPGVGEEAARQNLLAERERLRAERAAHDKEFPNLVEEPTAPVEESVAPPEKPLDSAPAPGYNKVGSRRAVATDEIPDEGLRTRAEDFAWEASLMPREQYANLDIPAELEPYKEQLLLLTSELRSANRLGREDLKHARRVWGPIVKGLEDGIKVIEDPTEKGVQSVLLVKNGEVEGWGLIIDGKTSGITAGRGSGSKVSAAELYKYMREHSEPDNIVTAPGELAARRYARKGAEGGRGNVAVAAGNDVAGAPPEAEAVRVGTGARPGERVAEAPGGAVATPGEEAGGKAGAGTDELNAGPLTASAEVPPAESHKETPGTVTIAGREYRNGETIQTGPHKGKVVINVEGPVLGKAASAEVPPAQPVKKAKAAETPASAPIAAPPAPAPAPPAKTAPKSKFRPEEPPSSGPLTAVTPEAPPVQKAPVAPPAPTAQKVPSVSEAPPVRKAPVAPAAPTVQKVPVTPEAPTVNRVPVAPPTPTVHRVPVAPEAPTVRKATPDVLKALKVKTPEKKQPVNVMEAIKSIGKKNEPPPQVETGKGEAADLAANLAGYEELGMKDRDYRELLPEHLQNRLLAKGETWKSRVQAELARLRGQTGPEERLNVAPTPKAPEARTYTAPTTPEKREKTFSERKMDELLAERTWDDSLRAKYDLGLNVRNKSQAIAVLRDRIAAEQAEQAPVVTTPAPVSTAQPVIRSAKTMRKEWEENQTVPPEFIAAFKRENKGAEPDAAQIASELPKWFAKMGAGRETTGTATPKPVGTPKPKAEDTSMKPRLVKKPDDTGISKSEYHPELTPEERDRLEELRHRKEQEGTAEWGEPQYSVGRRRALPAARDGSPIKYGVFDTRDGKVEAVYSADEALSEEGIWHPGHQDFVAPEMLRKIEDGEAFPFYVDRSGDIHLGGVAGKDLFGAQERYPENIHGQHAYEMGSGSKSFQEFAEEQGFGPLAEGKTHQEFVDDLTSQAHEMAKKWQEPQYSTAYHGSRSDFDKFDKSKIGTGLRNMVKEGHHGPYDDFWNHLTPDEEVELKNLEEKWYNEGRGISESAYKEGPAFAITDESHLDHGVTPEHLQFAQDHFADRKGFFAETVTLPDDLPPLKTSLHGPLEGDAPVPESEVSYGKRGTRGYESRLTNRAPRETNRMTVIAGPDENGKQTLYTAFGGELSPQEPLDPNVRDKAASERFWKEHALSKPEEEPPTDIGISKAEVAPGKAIGVTQPRLIKELAQNLYAGDLGTVVVKEGLQNAIDALPKGKRGKVSVDVDTASKTYTVEDNGIGMTPEVVKNQFLDPGGSYKPEGGRGGYGIAKIALLSHADSVTVETVAKTPEGLTKTTLTGSGERWLDTENPMDVTSVTVPPGTPTGTKVTIKLNDDARVSNYSTEEWLSQFMRDQKLDHDFDLKVDGRKITGGLDRALSYEDIPYLEYFNADDWRAYGGAEPFPNGDSPKIGHSQTPIYLDGKKYAYSVIVDKHGGNIDLYPPPGEKFKGEADTKTFSFEWPNGDAQSGRDATHRLQSLWTKPEFWDQFPGLSPIKQKAKPTVLHSANIPGARIEISASPTVTDQQYFNVGILNDGLPQFQSPVGLRQPTKMPNNIQVNIKPTVDTTHPDYPFTPNRQQLRDQISDYVTNYIKNDLYLAGVKREQQLYRNAMKNRTAIPGSKLQLFETTGAISKETLEEIANTPEVGRVASFIDQMLKSAAQTIKNSKSFMSDEAYAPWAEVDDFGAGLGYSGNKWFGLNIDAAKVYGNLDADKRAALKGNQKMFHILVDPWLTLRTISDKVPMAEQVQTFARDLWGTAVHEIMHTAYRAHDKDFSGALSKWLPQTVTEGVRLLHRLQGEVRNDPEFLNKLRAQQARLYREFSNRPGEDVLGPVSVESGYGGKGSDTGGSSGGRLPGGSSEEAGGAGGVGVTERPKEESTLSKIADFLIGKPRKTEGVDESRRSMLKTAGMAAVGAAAPETVAKAITGAVAEGGGGVIQTVLGNVSKAIPIILGKWTEAEKLFNDDPEGALKIAREAAGLREAAEVGFNFLKTHNELVGHGSTTGDKVELPDVPNGYMSPFGYTGEAPLHVLYTMTDAMKAVRHGVKKKDPELAGRVERAILRMAEGDTGPIKKLSAKIYGENADPQEAEVLRAKLAGNAMNLMSQVWPSNYWGGKGVDLVPGLMKMHPSEAQKFGQAAGVLPRVKKWITKQVTPERGPMSDLADSVSGKVEDVNKKLMAAKRAHILGEPQDPLLAKLLEKRPIEFLKEHGIDLKKMGLDTYHLTQNDFRKPAVRLALGRKPSIRLANAISQMERTLNWGHDFTEFPNITKKISKTDTELFRRAVANADPELRALMEAAGLVQPVTAEGVVSKKVARPNPTGFDEFYKMAMDAKLDNAKGRALYALSRKANAAFGGHTPPDRILQVMANAKPETAQKWLEHWEKGGSLKRLSPSAD